MAPEPESEGPFPFKGYAIINAIVWAFVLAALLMIRWWFKEGTGLGAFFVILAGAFTLVSVFDAIYDRVTGAKSPKPDSAEEAEDVDTPVEGAAADSREAEVSSAAAPEAKARKKRSTRR